VKQEHGVKDLLAAILHLTGRVEHLERALALSSSSSSSSSIVANGDVDSQQR
jgi:hypothetical protein